MSFAFIFPGQGSQSVGMLSTLSEKFPIVTDTFAEASQALGYDLWTLTQEGPAESLGKTEQTQPALLTAGVAVWRAWLEQGGLKPKAMAGHSLGEYTALTCAGAIDFADAVTLVRDRGSYMQSAVPEGEGGMAAVIGLTDQQVIDVCNTANDEQNTVQAVNFNAPGQVVIAGSKGGIEKAIPLLKEAGAKRALPLPVSIPAHSALMTPAAQQLEQRIQALDFKMPEIPVLHNCNVTFAATVDELKSNLVTQLDSPVQWVKSIESIAADADIQYMIESGPGKVLSGMVKRIAKGVNITAIDQPEALLTAIDEQK